MPVETYNALRTEYAALSAQHGSTTLEQLLDKAESEGRIFKSERGYMEGLGQQIGVAALSAQLDARQPVAALTTLQTDTVTVPDKRPPPLCCRLKISPPHVCWVKPKPSS